VPRPASGFAAADVVHDARSGTTFAAGVALLRVLPVPVVDRGRTRSAGVVHLAGALRREDRKPKDAGDRGRLGIGGAPRSRWAPRRRVATPPLRGGRRVELPGRLAQVRVAHDVVAVEHLPRLPADQLHGDALGHAGPHEIADGPAAKVVQHAAGDAGFAARRPPRLAEPPDRLAVRAGEDERDDAAEGALARDGAAPVEKGALLGRQREHPPLARLGRAGVEPDLAPREVHLRPAAPPPRSATALRTLARHRHSAMRSPRASTGGGFGMMMAEPAAMRFAVQHAMHASRRSSALTFGGSLGPSRWSGRRKPRV